MSTTKKKKPSKAALSASEVDRLLLTKHAYCIALTEFILATLRKALDKTFLDDELALIDRMQETRAMLRTALEKGGAK